MYAGIEAITPPAKPKPVPKFKYEEEFKWIGLWIYHFLITGFGSF